MESMISTQVRCFWAATISFLAASTFGDAAASSIVVLQVEATESSTSSYAPVNFAGASTVTSGGVVYHAWSSTADTHSYHAEGVRNRLLSASGTAVSDIYCEYAGDFVGDVYNYNANTVTKLKNAGVRVVNNSWVYSWGSSTDTPLRQKLDSLIQNADVVMVNGAVSDSSAITPVVWYAYNGIAVRGTQGFDASSTTTSGKSHADLWGPEQSGADEGASFETPGVAGSAAALIQKAKDLYSSTSTSGQNHLVVKSLLMTGASTTDTSTNGFTSWTRDTANNLDTDAGAGRVEYATSKYILEAGEKAMAAVSSSRITSPTVSTTTAGFTLDAGISNNSKEALVFYSASAFDNLTSTLCWDVTTSASSINLDLVLYSVTYSGGGYTLGSAVGLVGTSSTVTDDNVEHLYCTDTIAAGYYALVVTGTGASSSAYGLSYVYTAVPEPAALALLGFGALALLRRRR